MRESSNSTSLAEYIASSPVNSPKSSNSTAQCSVEPVLVMESEVRPRRGSTPRYDEIDSDSD